MSHSLRLSAGRVPDMISNFPMPQKLKKYIRQCKAVAFIRIYRLGCIITARMGKGIMVMKTGTDANGLPIWGPPSGCTVTGLAAAAAVGLEYTDFVTFIMEENMGSVFSGNNLGVSTNLCFTLGPFGSAAEAGMQSGGEDVTKMIGRSNGIFAGGTLEFSGILVDSAVNKAQYPGNADAIVRDVLKGENGIEIPKDAEFQKMYEALARCYRDATVHENAEPGGVLKAPSDAVTDTSTANVSRKEDGGADVASEVELGASKSQLACQNATPAVERLKGDTALEAAPVAA